VGVGNSAILGECQCILVRLNPVFDVAVPNGRHVVQAMQQVGRPEGIGWTFGDGIAETTHLDQPSSALV